MQFNPSVVLSLDFEDQIFHHSCQLRLSQEARGNSSFQSNVPLPWQCHDMETLSTLLAFCDGESTSHNAELSFDVSLRIDSSDCQLLVFWDGFPYLLHNELSRWWPIFMNDIHLGLAALYHFRKGYFCHSLNNLSMIFTHNSVHSENHWQIASLVT